MEVNTSIVEHLRRSLRTPEVNQPRPWHAYNCSGVFFRTRNKTSAEAVRRWGDGAGQKVVQQYDVPGTCGVEATI